MRPLSDLRPAEVAAVERAWPRLLALASEDRQHWGWEPWEFDAEISAARAVGLTLWPEALAKLAAEAAKVAAKAND